MKANASAADHVQVVVENVMDRALKMRQRAGIEIAALEIMGERSYSLTPSNKSSGGKYISMNLELLVHNEDERTYFYETLKAHPHIKMVL